MNIYSKIQPTLLLHILHKASDPQFGRRDLVPSDNLLQIAQISAIAGTTYRPHYHIDKPCAATYRPTQEAWVIISGSVRVTYYDTDQTVITQYILGPGDVTITLAGGGHNYEWLEDGRAVEVKSGPYSNQRDDKAFINQTTGKL